MAIKVNTYEPLEPFQSLLGFQLPLKIVDVGASPVEGHPPYANLMRYDHTSVMGFEPDPASLAVLNERKGKNETYLPFALGDGLPHAMHICRLPAMSSLLEPNPAVLALFTNFSILADVIGTLEIDTVRLDDVPECEGMDYLKIDTQGSELMILEHSTKHLQSALAVQVEVEFVPMYKNQPLFSEVELFMRSQGFILHRLSMLVERDVHPILRSDNPYNDHSQMMWADAIFIRDYFNNGKLSQNQLLKLATILHDCYGSYDISLHLLREYDRRTGGNLGDAFHGLVTSPVRQ